MSNREDRSSHGGIGAALGGIAGAFGGMALDKYTDPFKEYRGTLETMQKIEPRALEKIRMQALEDVSDYARRVGGMPRVKAGVEEAIKLLKERRPLPPEVASFADRVALFKELVPVARMKRLLTSGAIGLTAGSLGGLGTAALINKLRSRKSSSVGRVVPPSE